MFIYLICLFSGRPVHVYLLEAQDRPGGKALGIYDSEEKSWQSKSTWY